MEVQVMCQEQWVSASSQVPNTEKEVKAQSCRLSALICFRGVWNS